MTEEERKEKSTTQRNEIYRAIGHFAVEFQSMCDIMQGCIIEIFTYHGLKEQDHVNILLCDLTAMPLLRKLEGSCASFLKSNPKLDRVNTLFSYCQKLIEERNKIIHGTWFIGCASVTQTDFDLARGYKDKSNKKNGRERENLNYRAADFDSLTKKIKLTSYLLLLFRDAICSKELQDNLFPDEPPANLFSNELDYLTGLFKKI